MVKLSDKSGHAKQARVTEVHLTRFQGSFAPGAKLRPSQLPQAGAEPKPEEASVPPGQCAGPEERR
jgi:hypothetical protein